MSRIGKLPISIPSGVTITVDNDFITVKGPKGELQQFTMPGIAVNTKSIAVRPVEAYGIIPDRIILSPIGG